MACLPKEILGGGGGKTWPSGANYPPKCSPDRGSLLKGQNINIERSIIQTLDETWLWFGEPLPLYFIIMVLYVHACL